MTNTAEAIRSMVSLKLLIIDQKRKNGNGPEITPCDKCNNKVLSETSPCRDSEGPFHSREGLVCPLQKGVLNVVYHAGVNQ